MKKGQPLGFIEQLGTYVPVEVIFPAGPLNCMAGCGAAACSCTRAVCGTCQY